MSPYSAPSGTPNVTADLHHLWSTKALNLVWLPRCDNFGNPMLLHRSELDDHHANNPPPADPKGRPLWFWRVDAVFGAWVTRAAQRADQLRVILPERDLIPIITNYVQESGRETGELGTQAGVSLSGSDVMAHAAYLAVIGLGPQWDGYEKWLTKMDTRPKPTAVDLSPNTSRVPKSDRKRVKAAGAPSMF